MTIEEKKEQAKEIGGRYLYDQVCAYVIESKELGEVAKKALYFKKRSVWYCYCDKQNKKKSRMVEFDRDSFQRMVDKNYVELTKKLIPETSIFKITYLRTKTHSYA